jgi:serine/threonine-protein kinase
MFQRALALDGTAASTWANLGTSRYFQGQYHDAVRAMEKAVELAPGRYLYWGNLGDSYRWAKGLETKARGAYEKAIRLVREQLALTPNDRHRSSLAVYLVKSGDTAGALAELARLELARQTDKGTLFKVALVYELAHDRNRALAVLARAIREGYSMHEITNEPELAALRLDPRYARITTARN